MNPHDIGHAHVFLSLEKQAGDAEISYGLKGKLYLSKSGWLLLHVPNALGLGAFQALNEPGAELPVSETDGRYNAHISVCRPEELERIGGANLINERGKEYAFTLGPVRVVEPSGWVEMDRCWFIEARSPDLQNFRKSYGLPALPEKDGNALNFHITFAVRRRKVLRPGDIVKTMSRSTIIHNPSEYFKKAAAWIKSATKGVAIKPSAIDGQGLFASRDFQAGDVVLASCMREKPAIDGVKQYDQSDEARFTNHADDPNTELRVDNDRVQLIASRDIKSGEELTANYAAATKTLGDNFQYVYRGKPYHGESTARPQNSTLDARVSNQPDSMTTGRRLLSAIIKHADSSDAATISNESLAGGLADGKPDAAFPANALQKGQQVESEHTTNKQLAKEIAKDHLTEDLSYYEKLQKMEKSSQESYFGHALATQPMYWDAKQGVVGNVISHIDRVREAGYKQINDQVNYERLMKVLHPQRAAQRTTIPLAQRQPQLTHPIDRILYSA